MMILFNESGQGYWMEGCGCARAEGENRPSRPGHVVVGCDLYNGTLTGGVACALTASMEGAGNSGPKVMIYPDKARSLTARHDSSPCVDRGQNIIVLCDQGGVRMDLSTDTASTLRANATGHPPVVCVQYCGDKTDPSCDEHKAYCIPKNPFSDRQQAVCFTQNQRDEVRHIGGAEP